MKFNRMIGEHTGKMYSVEGNPLSEAAYKEHLANVLPGSEEMTTLEPIFKAGNWMTAGTA